MNQQAMPSALSLMTSPVSDGQVVLAKFLGAFIFYVVLWMPTALYVGLLHYLAPPGEC